MSSSAAPSDGRPAGARLREVPVVELDAARRPVFGSRPLRDGANLLEVEAVGVCGTDRHILDGAVPVPAGTVLGHEIIGRIGALPLPGELVTDWEPRPGDRAVLAPGISCGRCPNCLHHGMYCTNRRLYGLGTHGTGPHGGMAPALELWPGSRLFRLPEELPLGRAVFVEPVACAVRAVATGILTAGPLAGRDVAVTGFGAVGLAVATVAHAHGARVTVVEPSAVRRDLAKALSFEQAAPEDFAPGSGDGDAPAAGTGTFDLAVECGGNAAAYALAAGLLRPGGTLVEMGNFGNSGPSGVTPSDICQRDLRVLGTSETRDADFHTAIDIVVRTPVDLARVVETADWRELTDPEAVFAPGALLKKAIVLDPAKGPAGVPAPGTQLDHPTHTPTDTEGAEAR